VSIQHVHVALVVAAPRAVLVAGEDGHLTDEPLGRRRGALGDDGPLVDHPRIDRESRHGLGVREITQVDREQATRPQRLRDRDQGPIDRLRVGEVAQHVPDRDDRVRLRDRVVRQHELADLLRPGGVRAGQVEHRG
jgi:hypothetical protein